MLNIADIRILMVEDSDGDQFLLNDLLTHAGLRQGNLVFAESLKQALQQLQIQKFDVILLDLSLPDSSGITTFLTIAAQDGTVPVVILSGLRDMKLALEAITLGAQDYLIKGDFDEKVLSRTIRYSIERMNNLQALKESNERFNLVSKATNDMVWDWDLSTGEIFRNEEGWKKIFKTLPPNEVGKDLDWEAMVHPADLDKLRAAKNRVLTQKDSDHFEIECRVQRSDGSFAYILDRGYVVRDSEGKPLRLIGASHDITEKKKTEQLLKEEQLRKQKEITEAVIQAQEKERQKIGEELHDNVNQILASSLLYLNLTRNQGENARMFIDKTEEIINYAILEIRKLSHALVPPSLNGETLSNALNRLVEIAETTGTLTVEKDMQFIEEESIPEKLKLTIYRIAQEQMNNILKYAKASSVQMKLLQVDGQLIFSLTDNGIGFDPDQKLRGVGLMNIRTRASLHNGDVKILTAPGEGCSVQVNFPLITEMIRIADGPFAFE